MSLLRQPRFVLSLGVLGVASFMAIAPGWVLAASPSEHGPRDCHLRAPDGSYRDRLPPSSDHWFGTDAQGCDYFARAIHGARQSMIIGVGATVLILVAGAVLGVVAAMAGGWIDALVRRTGDVLLGVPLVVGASLLLSLVSRERHTAPDIALVLAAVSWPSVARVVRSRARIVLALPHVEATRSLGATSSWILVHHVLPDCATVALVYGTTTAGLVIAGEATLTFLGIGVSPPSVSWGLMIADAQSRLENSPHLLVIPAAFLTLVVLAFILLGDSLRDHLDPRHSNETLRGRTSPDR